MKLFLVFLKIHKKSARETCNQAIDERREKRGTKIYYLQGCANGENC